METNKYRLVPTPKDMYDDFVRIGADSGWNLPRARELLEGALEGRPTVLADFIRNRWKWFEQGFTQIGRNDLATQGAKNNGKVSY